MNARPLPDAKTDATPGSDSFLPHPFQFIIRISFTPLDGICNPFVLERELVAPKSVQCVRIVFHI